MSGPSSPSTSPVFIPHDGNNPGPDDPLDADFEDFATRMLALPIQNYPEIPSSFMVVVKEALQVHRDRKKNDHGLPSHSWYDEAYPDLVPASVESENAGPWQGFDPLDKLYRMRWNPYRFYWWLEHTPGWPLHSLYDKDEVESRLQVYADFILKEETSDKVPPQSLSDSERSSDAVPTINLVITATVTPILHLPPEMFLNIFARAKVDDPLIPFTISHVNRALRALVLGFAMLWADIDIMRGLERAAVQLHRSQQAALRICASILPIIPFEESTNNLVRFLSILSPSSARIEEFEAKFTEPSLPNLVFNLMVGYLKMPRLRSLTFGLVNRCSSFLKSDDISLDRLDASSPTALHILGFSGCLDQWLPVHLVELRVDEAMDVDAIKLFHSLQTTASTLKKLSISYSTFTSPSPDEIGRIGVVELACLGTLDVRCLCPKDIDMLRETLRMPNITSMTHALDAAVPYKSTEQYLLNISRNSPKLQTLILRDCDLHPEIWRQLGCGLRELVTLHLCWSSLRSDHISAFGSVRTDADEDCSEILPFPKLSSLILDNEIYLSSSDVVRMLKRRSDLRGKTGSEIGSLVMRGLDQAFIDAGDVQEIRKLVGALTLTVLDGGEELESSYASSSEDDVCDTADGWDSGDEAVVKNTIRMF